MSDLTMPMRRALRKVKRRRFCAYWLIRRPTLKALLRRRLVVPCGFYSVCLPKDQGWTLVSFSHPENAFDEATR